MALDPSSVGAESRVYECTYDWRTLSLYALGIGAKRAELDYLYEARGPKVYPTFAVVPSYPVLTELLGLTGGPYASVVHSGQSVRVHGEVPPQGVLRSRGRIRDIYDLKRMALVILETTSTLDERLLFELEWQIVYRGEGGFGGGRRPRPDTPSLPKRSPDWTFEELIAPEQALLYRLSGDTNPLHADPELAASVGFPEGPILHGLATFGFMCRAVCLRSDNGGAPRITQVSAQFKRPVWPGTTLRTEGWEEGNTVLVQSFAGAHAEPVLAGSVVRG